MLLFISGGGVTQLGFFELEEMKSQMLPSVIIRMLYSTTIHQHNYFLEKLIGEGIPASVLHNLQTTGASSGNLSCTLAAIVTA